LQGREFQHILWIEYLQRGKKEGEITREYGRCMHAKVDILFFLNFAKYVNFIQAKMNDKI
jgi:hypothetical protein